MSEKHSNNVPLLAEHGELAHAIQDHKTIASHSSVQDSTVSFFYTYLNGINAIAGFIIYNTCSLSMFISAFSKEILNLFLLPQCLV